LRRTRDSRLDRLTSRVLKSRQSDQRSMIHEAVLLILNYRVNRPFLKRSFASREKREKRRELVQKNSCASRERSRESTQLFNREFPSAGACSNFYSTIARDYSARADVRMPPAVFGEPISGSDFREEKEVSLLIRSCFLFLFTDDQPV